ncbi:hypothetical protein Acsp03_57760 [Actinomadura sp. NBRC 104412]|nr:hypothetical protein Acsp03_57760 [Actinomadura sp. NBRC 104412]
MCGVSHFKTTAQVAYYVSAGSALLIPNAWPAVSIIYEGQGDPDQILHAAQDWWKVNDKLGEVMQLSRQLRAGLDERSWSGDDRQNYDAKLSEYENQCMWSSMHAAAISMSLFGVMAMLMVFIAMMAVVAAILFALAMYVIAMYVASFFTAGASAAAAQAKANIIAGQCYAFLKSVATMFETIMRVAAAVLTGLFTLGVGVGGNVMSGNWRALADLGQGAWNSIDDVIAGSLGKLEQSLTSGLMKGRLGGQQLFKWTIPTQSIPRTARPWVAPLAGGKGGVDTAVGDPVFSSLIYGQRQYGDEYVDRTHPEV